MTRDHVTCDIYLSVGVLIDRRLTSVISKYKYLADISLVYLFVFQTRGRWSENSNHLSPNTCRSASLINRVHQFICNCTIVNSMHVLMIQNVWWYLETAEQWSGHLRGWQDKNPRCRDDTVLLGSGRLEMDLHHRDSNAKGTNSYLPHRVYSFCIRPTGT